MMNLAPSTHHQTVSRRLQFQLYQEIELTGRGQVFDAPVDLQLTDFDIVQPDLVIVLSQNKIITPTRILGVPDLVVEILSASTRRYDLNDKRALFERCKVPEYWAVDMENATLIRHVLEDTKFSVSQHADEVEYKVAGARIDLRRIWRSPLS